eukprot:8643674-Heterocapsa_arctica.AAC.1
MVIARMPEDHSKTFKNLQTERGWRFTQRIRLCLFVIRLRCSSFLVIGCTFLAQHYVAHPTVTARARPDSPETPKTPNNDVDRRTPD